MHILSPKAGISAEGGFCVKLTNNTGGNSVKGEIVEASGTQGFDQADANDVMPIGVCYDAGVANGSECWVVVGGIADVLIDAGGCTIGDWLGTGATAGSADGDAATPAAAQHFQEIGHALETRVGAGLAKGIIHFN